MRQLILTLTIGLSAIFLTGCSTYSRKQCETMDWEKNGAATALDGDTYEQVVKRAEKFCTQEHGIPVNSTALKLGFDSGLKELCTADSAEQFGRRGRRYQGTCAQLPPEEENKFLKGYQSGRNKYLEDEISSLRSQISSLESEVSSLKSELSSAQSDATTCQ